MSKLSQTEYHEQRERDERELAAKAVSPKVRDIHLDLAERYRQLANGEGEPESEDEQRVRLGVRF